MHGWMPAPSDWFTYICLNAEHQDAAFALAHAFFFWTACFVGEFVTGTHAEKRLTPEKQRMQRRPLVTRGRPSMLNATLMDCEWHG